LNLCGIYSILKRRDRNRYQWTGVPCNNALFDLKKSHFTIFIKTFSNYGVLYMNHDLPNDLRSLTAFRFFAAFWVFLFHLRSRIDYEKSWFWDVIEFGYLGVDFFFILSGFVIFHVYEPKIKSGQFSIRSYMIKRLARIYPLHLVMLLIFLAVAIVGNNQIQGAFASLTLLHAWGVTDRLVLNKPSWTLSAEMFAYIIFGLAVFRSPPTWLIAVAFFITAICAHAFAVNVGKLVFFHLTWDYGIFRIVPLFILGMLLRRLAPFVPSRIAVVIGLMGIGTFFWITQFEDVGYEILVPFVLLIVAGARLSDWQNLPTNSRLCVYLGEISYSTYMIHTFVIALWFDYLPKLGLNPLPWPMICGVVIIGSAISYHLIEVPSRQWINRYAVSKNSSRVAKIT
jgi:peptidoglycan/LPS O-acetylase OafA/YrhL